MAIREWDRASQSFEHWCGNVGGRIEEERVHPDDMPNDMFDDELHYLTCTVDDSVVRLYEHDGEVNGMDVDQLEGEENLSVDVGNIDITEIYAHGEFLRGKGDQEVAGGPLAPGETEAESISVEPRK